MAKKTRTKKKEKKNILNGIVHIQSTFNNTIVTITDPSGNVVAWSSAGVQGFKGAIFGTTGCRRRCQKSDGTWNEKC